MAAQARIKKIASADMTAQARIKKMARLIRSLEDQLDMLESAHRIQFESAASLKDKLSAAKRARSALIKARRISDLMSQILIIDDK